MDYTEQKALALEIFPVSLHDVINKGCFPCIAREIKRQDLVDACRDIVLEAGVQEWLVEWARHVGDRDFIRDKITEPENCFYWALNIGDQDLMINKVTEPKYCFYWALKIGDTDIMRDSVTEPEWCFKWGLHIGDRDLMRERVKGSKYEAMLEEFIEEKKNAL